MELQIIVCYKQVSAKQTCSLEAFQYWKFQISNPQCADMDMVKLWQLGCVKAYNTITTFSEQQLREINLKSQIFMVIYQTGEYSGVFLTILEEFENTIKLFQVSSTRCIFLGKTKTNEKTKKQRERKMLFKSMLARSCDTDH